MIEVYAEDEALTAEEEQCIRTACETALVEAAIFMDIAGFTRAIVSYPKVSFLCQSLPCN